MLRMISIMPAGFEWGFLKVPPQFQSRKWMVRKIGCQPGWRIQKTHRGCNPQPITEKCSSNWNRTPALPPVRQEPQRHWVKFIMKILQSNLFVISSCIKWLWVNAAASPQVCQRFQLNLTPVTLTPSTQLVAGNMLDSFCSSSCCVHPGALSRVYRCDSPRHPVLE